MKKGRKASDLSPSGAPMQSPQPDQVELASHLQSQKAFAHDIGRHIGTRVKRRRHSLGIKAVAIDLDAGLPPGTTAAIERDQYHPTSEDLYRLSRSLKVSVSFFFDSFDTNDEYLNVRMGVLLDTLSRMDNPALRQRILDIVEVLAADPQTINDKGDLDTMVQIEAAIAATGLICRGGFHPDPDDGAPVEAGTVVLLGLAGPSGWSAFQDGYRDEPDPLDNWSRRVIGDLAERLGAQPLYPFDGPPFLPFQKWAQMSEPVFHSPIGPLIHPTYGLWHSYRGALVFTERLTLVTMPDATNHCLSCSERRCLATCPVDALVPDRYDVSACTSHLSSHKGQNCMVWGCLARSACPVGENYAYPIDQKRFHMAQFLKSNR